VTKITQLFYPITQLPNYSSRKEFFLNRVIPVWNELPKEVREAKSLNCFKAGLDKMKLFKT
jgi:hypothetical protein